MLALTAVLIVLLTTANFATATSDSTWLKNRENETKLWRGMHLGISSSEKLPELKQFITETLAPKGFNVLIVEVNYSFQFKSHPELAGRGLNKAQARELAQLCRKHGIRLIPLFNCLGHQSQAGKTFALLEKYPQFDETPHIPRDNKGIYCREWCPSHPDVNKIVFDLLDEVIDAFDADALHVGMDEVFLIGNDQCPRCKGKNPGELYAKVVNELHQHIAVEKGLEMLMWGDRLLDASTTDYGEWESSKTGSHTAIDLIPKDIIICDWHYTEREDYPSVRFFQQKGLRVLPSTWNNAGAALALLKTAQKGATDKMLGFLFTGWGVKPEELTSIFLGTNDTSKVSDDVKGVAEAIKLCANELNRLAETPKITVIPKPIETKLTGGHFTLEQKSAIYYDGAESGAAEVKAVAKYLAEQLRPATGLSLVVLDDSKAKPPTDSILLTTKDADKDLGEEGYELVVTKNNIILRALRPAGLFYGVQTIRQLLPPQIESRKKIADTCWTIPCVQIKDRPRFGWRGSLLDCCRQFMSVDFLKHYIDLLAYHKMNRFHWHLTDDPGWRIEIKKYPKLTEISAWRNTGSGYLRPPEDPPETDEIYGGYYTQEDIKDIVAYAKSRYVTVVPEIEMPGHSSSAMAAYPELSCTGGPFKVQNTMGISKDVYCPGNEKTFEFLEDVLSEVVELFPSLYIHIGGDECPKDRWQQCPKCQARIKAEGLKDEHELQSYFIKRIEKLLLAKGRRLIGWDEILEGGLAPQATVQSWRGMEGAVAAAQQGHDVIASPTSHCYFDYPHTKKQAASLPDWMGLLPTEKVYSFEPIPEGLTAEQQRHILGGEGNVWTEVAPQEEVDSRAYPRLTALAEALWSPKELRSWEDFSNRMQAHYKRFDILGVDYYSEKKP